MKNITALIFLALLTSCSTPPQGDTLILFMEKEKGVEPYQTRMIITKKFVRVDDGEGAKSFVLYDRNKKVVYSINPEEKTIMAVHEKKQEKNAKVEPPFKLEHSFKEMPAMKDAPSIDGMQAKHYQLLTNNEVCYDVVAIKGLMPDAVTALTEFHKHMAADSLQTFNNIPADLHNACDMSMTTFAPARQFQFGFPIQEWGNREYVRFLIDYKTNYEAAPTLFDFPQDYKHYSVQELREGKVKFEN